MKGRTYFRRYGFSINEGEIPNIHLSWNNNQSLGVYLYICLTPKYRFAWTSKKGRIL